jgi:hypothetical protein
MHHKRLSSDTGRGNDRGGIRTFLYKPVYDLTGHSKTNIHSIAATITGVSD